MYLRIVKVIIISITSYLGFYYLNDYLVGHDFSKFKTFKLREIEGKDPNDLPRYFNLNDVIEINRMFIDSEFQENKLGKRVINTVTYPIYSISKKDIEFYSQEKSFVYIERLDGAEFVDRNGDYSKPINLIVKNSFSTITDKEIEIFENSNLNISKSSFKLIIGFKKPNKIQLWFAILSLAISFIVLISLIYTFVFKNNNE